MDAAHLPDDDLDEQTANDIARFYRLAGQRQGDLSGKHRLRQCTDPRAGHFLRRLAQVRASRVLISTRLYPAELQTDTAQPRPGCYPLFLTGLSDDDALALWRAFIGGARSGTSEQLRPLFAPFITTRCCCAPWPARWLDIGPRRETSTAGARLMPTSTPSRCR